MVLIKKKVYSLFAQGNRRARVCFNCGEETHGIADCPLPKNMKEIQRRKAEIRKQNNVPTLSGNKATVRFRMNFVKAGGYHLHL